MPMPAKPAEVHALQGTRSKARPKSDSGIQGGRPKFPAHLTAAAKPEFKRLVALLEERRVVTPGDAVLLALAAEIAARWFIAKRDVQTRGLTITTTILSSNGEPLEKEKKNPCLAIAQESEKTLLSILDRLGLSPINREKVKPLKENADELPADSVGALLALEEKKNAV